MRLFFAIPLSLEAAEAAAALQARLIATRADVRWVDKGAFHITVKFLGETPDALAAELSARLSRVAGEVPVFPLEMEGVERLPERGPPRVIVCPVKSPDLRIVKLHRLLDSAVGGIGLEMDKHTLTPHVTLGRISSSSGLNRLLRLMDKHAFDPLGRFEVQTVRLVASTPGPEGSVYRVVHEAALRAAAPVETKSRAAHGG